MTDYKLTEDDRKLLTEFLGKYWHEIKWNKTDYNQCVSPNCSCGITGLHPTESCFYENEQRTFTTPSDQHAVFTKLVEVGKWEEFEESDRLVNAFYTRSDDENINDDFNKWSEWLFINPERFNKLVADYLKEEGKC
jgi:hypothetical protein